MKLLVSAAYTLMLLWHNYKDNQVCPQAAINEKAFWMEFNVHILWL